MDDLSGRGLGSGLGLGRVDQGSTFHHLFGVESAREPAEQQGDGGDDAEFDAKLVQELLGTRYWVLGTGHWVLALLLAAGGVHGRTKTTRVLLLLLLLLLEQASVVFSALVAADSGAAAQVSWP